MMNVCWDWLGPLSFGVMRQVAGYGRRERTQRRGRSAQLSPFVQAQEDDYEQALAEIRA